MTGLDIFLILVGITSLTERLMKIIVFGPPKRQEKRL